MNIRFTSPPLENNDALSLPTSNEIGSLGIMHLKRYWQKAILKRSGKLKQEDTDSEWKVDIALLAALRLGLEPTLKYLFQKNPTFEEFENWIVATTEKVDQDNIKQFNQLFSGNRAVGTSQQAYEVLSQTDLDFWQQNGYVIIRNAVTIEDCDEAIEALCSHIGIERYNADTWYRHHPAQQGIMVQLFQHPVLEKNRKAPRIRKAFEELWQRTDLWVNADRVGFNPPETDDHKFSGPRLHWDLKLETPIPFGLQGILYLADTAENQGAFTLVPGFQHKIDDWLNQLPAGLDPQKQDLYALGTKPIAANAGDFIIWHHALPHGSSPNTAQVPRFVQYINYIPAY